MKREQFYDQSMQLKNINNIEDSEEQIFDKHSNINYGDDDDEYDDENLEKEELEDTKKIVKIYKKKKVMGENSTVIVGTKVFEGLDNVDDNVDDVDNIDDVDDTIEGFDGFTTPVTTNYASIISSTSSTTQQQKSQPKVQISSIQPTTINTTLFDNLNINDTQIKLCKTNYNQVINTYITDLSKLVKLSKNNEYLNTKKQYDVIIGKGVDNITNYLSNTIKSPLVLTRTSIKSDLMNSLSNNLEELINNKNVDITNQMNSLAAMSSTTIDYNTMLTNINDSRAQLDNYIEIDKLVSNYGKTITNNSNEVNNVLNKSFILPIYERNFDKINQLVKSDFNENENNLSKKYGQAYTDFLNEEKKKELDINPLRLASKIESGIVNMLTNLVSDGRKKDNNTSIRGNNTNGNNIIESVSNPIPTQQNDFISGNSSNSSNTNLNNNANIYKDKGNLGSYLIDKKTQKQVLEGFANGSDNSDSSPNPTETNPTKYESKTKKNKNNTDIVSNLLSGEFIQYIMDIINEKIGYLTGMYSKQFTSSNGNDKDNKDNDIKFNLEENMIPAGFLFFILSMLIYFIDTTS